MTELEEKVKWLVTHERLTQAKEELTEQLRATTRALADHIDNKPDHVELPTEPR